MFQPCKEASLTVTELMCELMQGPNYSQILGCKAWLRPCGEWGDAVGFWSEK